MGDWAKRDANCNGRQLDRKCVERNAGVVVKHRGKVRESEAVEEAKKCASVHKRQSKLPGSRFGACKERAVIEKRTSQSCVLGECIQ
jgi:hypothetical protein